LSIVRIRKPPSVQRLSGAFPAEFPLPNKFEIHTERGGGEGGSGRGGERCGFEEGEESGHQDMFRRLFPRHIWEIFHQTYIGEI
jgi:hypothetical protein